MAEDIGGVWRTVGGRRIFIKDGEDLTAAMKNSRKFEKKKDDLQKTKESDDKDKEIFEKISKFYGYDKLSDIEIEDILKFAEERKLYHSQNDIDAMRRYMKKRKNKK